MKLSKSNLKKRKIALRAITTQRLEEMLNFEQAKLKNINSTIQFQNKQLSIEENRIYYSTPVLQVIELIKGELQERKEADSEQSI
ncbi:MAG: hypothetical protein E7379_00655 [Clostridiales bacterium]|nr:hypothetical protein [Clostridiales bacterium]